MLVDTGASLSLISETTFREHRPQRSLSSTQVRLCSYSGEVIAVLGSVDVNVTYKSQSVTVPLIVVKCSGLTLMGCNWLELIKLDWQEILLLQNDPVSPIQNLLQKHSDVFQEGLGTLTDFKAKIRVDPQLNQNTVNRVQSHIFYRTR